MLFTTCKAGSQTPAVVTALTTALIENCSFEGDRHLVVGLATSMTCLASQVCSGEKGRD